MNMFLSVKNVLNKKTAYTRYNVLFLAKQTYHVESKVLLELRKAGDKTQEKLIEKAFFRKRQATFDNT